MTSQIPHQTQPRRNTIYGLTHHQDGEPIIRLPRSMKVSIGIPAGKAAHAFCTKNDLIGIVMGEKKASFKTIPEAKAFWENEYPNAPDSKFPRRLEYFTFRQLNRAGDLEPAWEAILRHGHQPTTIDIRFITTEPFDSAIEWWGGGRRKCWGDGQNALRLIEFPTAQGHKELAAEAKAHGDKWFPIVGACRNGGCPLGAKSVNNGREYPAQCKNHGRLGFLLEHLPSIGAQAEINTTGYRSVSQIFSSLHTIKMIVQGMGLSIVGIPLQLSVAPYTIDVNGKPTEQYAIRVVMSADSLQGLKNRLITASADFHNKQPLQITAAEPVIDVSNLPEMTEDEGEAFQAEFVPEAMEPDEDDFGESEQPRTSQQEAKESTEAKTAGLADRLAERKLTAPVEQALSGAPPEPPAVTNQQGPKPPRKTTPTF